MCFQEAGPVSPVRVDQIPEKYFVTVSGFEDTPSPAAAPGSHGDSVHVTTAHAQKPRNVTEVWHVGSYVVLGEVWRLWPSKWPTKDNQRVGLISILETSFTYGYNWVPGEASVDTRNMKTRPKITTVTRTLEIWRFQMWCKIVLGHPMTGWQEEGNFKL